MQDIQVVVEEVGMEVGHRVGLEQVAVDHKQAGLGRIHMEGKDSPEVGTPVAEEHNLEAHNLEARNLEGGNNLEMEGSQLVVRGLFVFVHKDWQRHELQR